nr:hypothetical protein [Tanacetum cinerariifolium]
MLLLVRQPKQKPSLITADPNEHPLLISPNAPSSGFMTAGDDGIVTRLVVVVTWCSSGGGVAVKGSGGCGGFMVVLASVVVVAVAARGWGGDSVVGEAREGEWDNRSGRSEGGEQFWVRRKKPTGKISDGGGVVAGGRK